MSSPDAAFEVLASVSATFVASVLFRANWSMMSPSMRAAVDTSVRAAADS